MKTNAAELPAPILIAQPDELDALVATLGSQPVIAVDTESNSLFAYRERVCLIQFSTPQADYIVDPLSLQEMQPLGEIFSAPEIEKVFHAAEYDLIGMHRDFGWNIEGVFDTMIAARTLGRAQVGLAAMLKGEFGVTINKRFQRADWGERPLSAEKLAYARLDTHYLIELRNRLARELRRAGRWDEALEEFERIRAGSIRMADESSTNGRDEAGFWRISGVRDLTARQVAILRELHRYRQRMAERWDRPEFKVIGDHTLIAIAKKKPRLLKELETLTGMTPGQIRRHGKALLEAVQIGRKANAPRRPAAQRVDDDIMQRYEALHRWRKDRARQRGVESDVILARDVLWNLARNNPATEADLESIKDLGPWRRNHYGAEVLGVLREIS